MIGEKARHGHILQAVHHATMIFRSQHARLGEAIAHGDPNGGTEIRMCHQGRRPYWTRAHRDWRVWVGVVLMLVP
jgi:hypothetical protein